jgi:hypothetical protein
MNQSTNNITTNIVNKPIPPTMVADSGQKKKIFAIILIVIAIIFIILLSRQDSTAFMKTSYLYIILISFLLFGILVYFISNFDTNERNMSMTFLFLVFTIIIIITIIASMVNYMSVSLSTNFILNGLLVIIILLAMSIFYISFLNKPGLRVGLFSFIINLIFYIPCLLNDAVNYILRDFINTPRSVFHLIFIEFIFIFSFFYLYPKIHHSTTNNGVVLLEDPAVLNKQTSIDSDLYRSFFNKKEDPISNTVTLSSPFRSTFSISMWVYLNIQPFTQLSYTREISIFEYKSPDISGCGCMNHPKVTYKNNQSGLDKYIFYLAPNNNKTDSIKYMVSLPHQKWNNIVFNYRDGAVDIFINGNFETTISIPVPIQFTNNDTINIGNNELISDRSGAYGSICNIVYYKNILSKGEIIKNYNLLSINNPPI